MVQIQSICNGRKN